MPDYNIAEIAKLESSISGIIAGFALTIIILLIERLSNNSSKSQHDQSSGKAAIVIFVGTFFGSVIASYLYAVVAGENVGSETHSVSLARVTFMMLPAAFAFALSSILLCMGLVHVLAAHKLDYVLGPAKAVLILAIIVALAQMTYTTSDTMAIMKNASARAWLSIPTDASLFLIPIVGCSLGWLTCFVIYRREPGTAVEQGLDKFVYACIFAIASCALALPLIVSSPRDVYVEPWVIVLFIIALSFLSGWALNYLPETEKSKASLRARILSQH